MSKADNKELEKSIIMFKKLDIGEDDKEFKKARNVILKELKRLQEETIPKDKIREKIEDLNKNKDMISGGYAISILEELLE